MKFDQLFQSDYLSKEDVKAPIKLTIADVIISEMQVDGRLQPKPVIVFRGARKRMVLNRINGETLCDLYGDETEDWIGRQVWLFVDPTVMMGNRRVGGIRLQDPNSPPQNVRAAHPGFNRYMEDPQTGATYDSQTETVYNAPAPLEQTRRPPPPAITDEEIPF